jgi:hypothetical protein
MKIKRSKIYNNPQSIIVIMKSTIINFKVKDGERRERVCYVE